MDFMKFYNTNDDFRSYVEKYRSDRGISVEEALEHEMVKQYAFWLLSWNNGMVIDTL